MKNFSIEEINEEIEDLAPRRPSSICQRRNIHRLIDLVKS